MARKMEDYSMSARLALVIVKVMVAFDKDPLLVCRYLYACSFQT